MALVYIEKVLAATVLKAQITTSYPLRTANTAPTRLESAVGTRGSNVLQTLAALLIVIHMARPFDVVLKGFHIPMMVCGLAVIAAFICRGLNGINTAIGKTLTAFLVWNVLVTPFSIWKGGSARYDWQYFGLMYVLVLVLAGAPSSIKQLIRLIWILAVSSTISIVWFSRGGGAADGGRVYGGGEWGNAGDFALTAGFLLPFCIFTARLIKNQIVKYIVVSAWALFMLRTMAATATRSAILGLGCVAVVLLFRVNMLKRVGIVLAGVIATAIVVATIPGQTLERIGTLTAVVGLTEESETGQAAKTSEAMTSAAERKELQMDALKTIRDNFLVGVGPGQFAFYRFTHFFDRAGRNKHWFPPHNTYLQIAAECGIPGGLLYILFIGSIFLTIHRVRRLNRPGSHPRWQLVNQIALCLEVSLVFFAFCAAFLNCQTYAHQFIIAGMAIALERLTRMEIAQTPTAESRALPTFGPPRAVGLSGGRSMPSRSRPLPSRSRPLPSRSRVFDN
jgi:O-antigen ligase